MDVEGGTLVGFYDDRALLLMWGQLLRETTVRRIFDEPDIAVFEGIEGPSRVYPCTDVSLLNARRVLYYPTINGRLGVFDVDRRTNTEVEVGRTVRTMASFTGIDCGVRAVFYSDDRCTYTLGEDGALAEVGGSQSGFLNTAFPSPHSRSVGDALLKYNSYLVRGGREVGTGGLVALEYNYSVVRVYRDTFLAYDRGTKSWLLTRIAL